MIELSRSHDRQEYGWIGYCWLPMTTAIFQTVAGPDRGVGFPHDYVFFLVRKKRANSVDIISSTSIPVRPSTNNDLLGASRRDDIDDVVAFQNGSQVPEDHPGLIS